MKTTNNIKWDEIDNSPEGELLKTAICVIGYLHFKDKEPSLILEVIKDLKNNNPFISETLEETMKRVETRIQSENN